MPSDRAFIVNLPLNLTLSRHENWHRIGSLRKHQIVQTFNNATKTDLLLIELDIRYYLILVYQYYQSWFDIYLKKICY